MVGYCEGPFLLYFLVWKMKALVVTLLVAAVVLLCTGHIILACGAVMLAGTVSRFIIRKPTL